MTDKKIILHPNHAYNSWWYLVGVLLIPLFGIGLYLIYRTYSKLKQTQYEITDHTIRALTPGYSENMDLAEILSVDVKQRFIDRYFSMGTLVLQTSSRTLEMIGMKNPEQLSSLILQAAKSERKRLEEIKESTPKPVESNPGSMEKINYLTGLWQQGLISNEDFQKEKRHFEG